MLDFGPKPLKLPRMTADKATATPTSLKDCLRPLADGAIQSAVLGWRFGLANNQEHYTKGMRVLDTVNKTFDEIKRIMEEKP